MLLLTTQHASVSWDCLTALIEKVTFQLSGDFIQMTGVLYFRKPFCGFRPLLCKIRKWSTCALSALHALADISHRLDGKKDIEPFCGSM